MKAIRKFIKLPAGKSFKKATIEEAIEEIKKGNMILVTDSEDRENEGDLVMAASCVTSEKINFMTTYGKGLVCAPLTSEKAHKLGLEPMVMQNEESHQTAFTVSVDARNDVSTGISAHDRANTISKLADSSTVAEDFVRPGHIFPLIAREGGVLVRAGHTEAAVDLAKLAGFEGAGVICEVINEDGTMARMPDLEEFSLKYDIKLVTIADLIEYRRQREVMVSQVAEARIPTNHGVFKMKAFTNSIDTKEHFALVMGEVSPEEPTLVRVHSECLTGDVFHSLRCDCGAQLDAAMAKIAQNQSGVLLYMRQEGRGIGIINKLKAYNFQDEGLDTVEANKKLGYDADLRDYGIGAQILSSLGIKKIKLMTNNPRKVVGLEGYGLEITERVSLVMEANPHNEKYLSTKHERLGHYLNKSD